MSKILVATEKPFAAKAVDAMRDVIEGAGCELELLERYTDRNELLSAVATADGLIVRSDKVNAEVIEAAPGLKIIVRAGAGYDNIDLAAATARGIVVENTPGQNSNAVAELVFGLLVMAARNMYNGTTGIELKGKRLGLQAFGQVGRNVARIAAGYGMEVSALDPYCPDEVMEAAGVKPVHTAEELYRDNDIVSIHIPATPETTGSIGRDLLSLLPHGAIVVNTARREVIDEAALGTILDERPDIKYVADVAPTDAAALTAAHPTQVYFTPKKMGAQTAEANYNAGVAAARQTTDYLLEGIDRYRVN